MVLIKYSGKYVKIYFNMKITFFIVLRLLLFFFLASEKFAQTKRKSESEDAKTVKKIKNTEINSMDQKIQQMLSCEFICLLFYCFCC